MGFGDIRLELRGPQTGLSLYEGNSYLGTYRSFNDCVMDLTYRFPVQDLERIAGLFHQAPNCSIDAPYEYRGVCSEMFWPTDTIFRYVYYRNTLTELFDCFAFHEERALLWEDTFCYGVQGTGIHRFNPDSLKYEFWLGGSNLKTVSDVMGELKKRNEAFPGCLIEEFREASGFDVFISHKSEDYPSARAVYDILERNGKKIFLSEVSLPALSSSDYTSSIDEALDQAKGMVVIASSVEKVNSGWVKYEWTSFLNEKRAGRKSGNLVTVVTDEKMISSLPYALRQCEVIPIERAESILQYF